MAGNEPPKLASGNLCCLAWQGKYIDMKKRRDACKEARDILTQVMEKANLEKTGRDTKGHDSAVNASLEKEISDLKSEILSLQQNLKEKSEVTKLLKDHASSREKEISELKDLLKKETLRADNSEEDREKVCQELTKTKASIVNFEVIKPDVPQLMKEISLVKNLLASERQKTESERGKAESEKKKADQYLSELEVLRTTAHKTSSDLRTLTSNLETVKKQLEFEKQMTMKERERADMESEKAREQMKLAEDLSKKFKKEAELQNSNSKVKFAENAVKREEKKRLLEMSKQPNLETVKKQLEFEKQMTMKERERADMESEKAREQMKLAEDLSKKFKKEAESQNSNSKVKFAENAVKREEKKRLLEMSEQPNLETVKKQLEFEKQMTMKERKRADMESEKTREQMKLAEDLFKSLNRKVKFAENVVKREEQKRLLEMKQTAMDGKKRAEFETFQREIEAEELRRLMLGLGSLSNRLKLMGEYYLRPDEDTANKVVNEHPGKRRKMSHL